MAGIFFLAACGQAKDATDYVNVSFSGMSGAGSATYNMDESKMFEDIFDMDSKSDSVNRETLKEMGQISDAYKIKLDKKRELSNGDKVKVTVSVNEDETKKIKGGQKEITVKGLEEPKELTSEDVENNLNVDFNGANGRGEANVYNNLDSGLSTIDFEVENDGKLKNGEQAKIILKDEDSKNDMLRFGYVLADDFQPTVKVKDLYNVAEKASDIANLKDIQKQTEKDAKKQYSPGVVLEGHKIKLEKWMYRQFGEDKDDDYNSDKIGTSDVSDHDGTLIGIYSVTKTEKVYDENKKDLANKVTHFIAIKGYTDIRLDDNNKADLSDIGEVFGRHKTSESMKSVIKGYKEAGFSEVEN
ncbi:hypothetical protein ACFSMW_11695 [Virgibacillus halophilus]